MSQRILKALIEPSPSTMEVDEQGSSSMVRHLPSVLEFPGSIYASISSKQLNGSKKIINDPHCDCGEIEDTEHYLLNCNLFQNLREELLNTVITYCQPTLNVLLNENAYLSESEIKTIFRYVDLYRRTQQDVHEAMF